MVKGAAKVFDVIVLGAGAAGLFCAAQAGARGLDVLVLEGNERVGLKILVSGGGRANFTNRTVSHENYVSRNKHFARSALARYPSTRFIELVEAHGIPFHEREHGQLFCDESAKRITRLLLDECDVAGVSLRTGCRIAADDVIEAPSGAAPTRFVVRVGGERLATQSLVIATGGRSWPRLGTTDLGYDVARRWGLDLVALRPGLVPLQWSAAERATFGELAGIAVPASVSFGRATFREAVLFTHGGLSGPAILQISNHWIPGDAVTIDWLPDHAALLADAKATGGSASARRLLAERLPRRLVSGLVGGHPAAERSIAQVSGKDLAALDARVHAFEFRPAGDAGWDKAEVTLGGIDTACLSSRTLAANDVPGLHFVGEVVDVTGWLGGFNFQWAWASAHAAAEALADELQRR